MTPRLLVAPRLSPPTALTAASPVPRNSSRRTSRRWPLHQLLLPCGHRAPHRRPARRPLVRDESERRRSASAARCPRPLALSDRSTRGPMGHGEVHPRALPGLDPRRRWDRRGRPRDHLCRQVADERLSGRNANPRSRCSRRRRSASVPSYRRPRHQRRIQGMHNAIWKLAFVINGKADAKLLETYNTERRSIARWTADQSLRNSQQVAMIAAAAMAGRESNMDPAEIVATSAATGTISALSSAQSTRRPPSFQMASVHPSRLIHTPTTFPARGRDTALPTSRSAAGEVSQASTCSVPASQFYLALRDRIGGAVPNSLPESLVSRLPPTSLMTCRWRTQTVSFTTSMASTVWALSSFGPTVTSRSALHPQLVGRRTC